MAGTPVGSVDHQFGIGTTAAETTQESFKILYDFLNTTMVGAGYATRVALQFGSGGTGTDFWDGASPFGENAFAVFRMNTSAARPGGGSVLGAYYVLIQWADASPFGSAPGSPGLLKNATGDGVGMTVAFREDGTSPWAGTTNNDGTDTKGTPVWTAGGSVLHVLDRQNSPGPPVGNSNTNKQNTQRVIRDAGAFTTPHRLHCIGDADSMVVLFDDTDNNSYSISYAGIYLPPSGVTANYPMIFGTNDSTGFWPGITRFGDTDSSGAEQGGLTNPIDQDVAFLIGSIMDGITNASPSYQPNPFRSPAALDEIAIRIQSDEQTLGFAGVIDPAVMAMVAATTGLSEDANAALTRAFFGDGIGTFFVSVPWGGGSPPGTNNTRSGIQF